jgi:hypothetical protein
MRFAANTRFIAPLAACVIAAALAIVVLPGGSQAASSTQTLRFYEKQTAIKLTHADGTEAKPPLGDPKPGDVLEVNSLGYAGTHTHHAKHWTSSTHLICRFGTGEPDCVSHFAIGGSMLVFSGNPGTVTNGTGIYQRATGKVVSSKEIAGTDDADVVAKIHLRRYEGGVMRFTHFDPRGATFCGLQIHESASYTFKRDGSARVRWWLWR